MVINKKSSANEPRPLYNAITQPHTLHSLPSTHTPPVTSRSCLRALIAWNPRDRSTAISHICMGEIPRLLQATAVRASTHQAVPHTLLQCPVHIPVPCARYRPRRTICRRETPIKCHPRKLLLATFCRGIIKTS